MLFSSLFVAYCVAYAFKVFVPFQFDGTYHSLLSVYAKFYNGLVSKLYDYCPANADARAPTYDAEPAGANNDNCDEQTLEKCNVDKRLSSKTLRTARKSGAAPSWMRRTTSTPCSTTTSMLSNISTAGVQKVR